VYTVWHNRSLLPLRVVVPNSYATDSGTTLNSSWYRVLVSTMVSVLAPRDIILDEKMYADSAQSPATAIGCLLLPMSSLFRVERVSWGTRVNHIAELTVNFKAVATVDRTQGSVSGRLALRYSVRKEDPSVGAPCIALSLSTRSF
jgi:hypothetical protein